MHKRILLLNIVWGSALAKLVLFAKTGIIVWGS